MNFECSGTAARVTLNHSAAWGMDKLCIALPLQSPCSWLVQLRFLGDMVVIRSMSMCCKKWSVVHFHVHGRMVRCGTAARLTLNHSAAWGMDKLCIALPLQSPCSWLVQLRFLGDMVVIPSMSTCCKKSSVVHIHVHGRVVRCWGRGRRSGRSTTRPDHTCLPGEDRWSGRVEHLFEDWIFSGNALERSVPESVSGTECSKGTWTMFSLSITLMKWGWQLQ